MKKLLITATATLACVAAFAQGKVQFVNDSLHLVYMTTDTGSLLPTDAASAGMATPATVNATLSVDLWAGTSANSLAKVSTTSFGAIPGKWTSQNTVLPFAGGSTDFYEVQVYATAAGSEANAKLTPLMYYGDSGVFTVVAGAGASYLSIVSSLSSTTWAPGSYPVPGGSNLGAIMLQANVPEPTTLALAGLGIASLLAFRRRK
jgi:hypothetical protein